MIFRLALALSLVTCLGCGDDDGSVDSGGVDSGGVDSGSVDSGALMDSGMDSGADDAGADDAGADDAGADDAGDSGGGDLVTMFCEASAARDEMCGDTPPDFEECVAEQECTLNVVFRSDAAPAVVECVGELDCESSDDPCYSATGLDLDPSEGAADYTSACTMRREECGAGFSDDYCFFDLAAAEIYTALTACLEEECDAVGACLFNVVTCAE